MPDRLSFVISRALRERTEDAIGAVRRDPSDPAARTEFIDVVRQLTETGLEYYFLLPLELAGVGMVARRTAQVGVAAARTGIPRVIRQVIRSMSEAEVLEIVEFVDGILIRDETPRAPRA